MDNYHTHYMKRFGSCSCYKCVGKEFEWDQETATKRLVNTMESHTFLEACDCCGRLKTEFLDLGRKGRYICWWCRKRAAGTDGPETASPTPQIPTGATA